MKKVTGEASSFHYCTIDPLTGEVLSERTLSLIICLVVRVLLRAGLMLSMLLMLPS